MKRILGATVILIAIIAVIASVNFTMQQQHSQRAASVATSKARAAKASRKHVESVSENGPLVTPLLLLQLLKISTAPLLQLSQR